MPEAEGRMQEARCSPVSVSDSDPLGWVAGADLLLVWLTWKKKLRLTTNEQDVLVVKNCPLQESGFTLRLLCGAGTAPSVSLWPVMAVDWEEAKFCFLRATTSTTFSLFWGAELEEVNRVLLACLGSTTGQKI